MNATRFCTVAIHLPGESEVRIDVTRIPAASPAEAQSIAVSTLQRVAAAPTETLRTHLVSLETITDIELR